MPSKTMPSNASGWSTALRRKLNYFQSHFARRKPSASSSLKRALSIEDVKPKGTVIVKAGTEGTLLVKAHLPGLRAEDINFDVTDDLLTLRGDRRKTGGMRQMRHDRRKQHLGFFQHALQLPSGVERDKVDATFENGVLTITVPMSEGSNRRKIDIKPA